MATTKEKIENFTGIQIGDTVAFNRSGDVILGIVESIDAFQFLWYTRPSHIQVNAVVRACIDGKVSRVKNMASIVKVHPGSVNI